MSILSGFLRRIKRKLCDHERYDVLDEIGPTYRGKVWRSCICKDCGQHFVYEKHSGKRYMTKGPGFSFQVV